jgi:hypothetical protein
MYITVMFGAVMHWVTGIFVSSRLRDFYSSKALRLAVVPAQPPFH